MLRPVLLLLAATVCWGASSAVLAHVEVARAGAAPLVAAGGGAALLALAVLRGRRPLRALRAGRGTFVVVAGLEAVNLGLYVASLQVGPLPLMVALHLTAPVILLGVDVARRRRPVTAVVALELGLVVAAVALVAVAAPDGTTSGDVLLGSLLALGSAAALAVLIVQVSRRSSGQDADVAAGLQLSLVALLTLPLLLTGAPDPTDAGWLLLCGAGLLGPGFALYWRALRTMDAPLAGILGLNEAVVASVVGALAFGEAVGPATAAAGALILAAVVLEIRRRPRPAEPLAGP
ncbi:MAG: EamA family transporter [Solirubrobacteraceae bacterium]|nr:EamA family transporter [Solirubrobacteraceae bacterium]